METFVLDLQVRDTLIALLKFLLNLFGLQRILGPRVIMISRYHVGINFLSYLPNLENPTPL
jgi:hypothetical protein